MFRGHRKLDDFSHEIEAHLELEVERLRGEGLSSAEARTAARRAFGNVTRARERFYEARRWRLWDQLRQDVSYGIGMLRRAPGFSLIAVATMALGIGATTAIFSVVDATLLHPLPYPHPEQLVSVTDDLPGVGSRNVGMSVPEWHDLQRSGIFAHIGPIGGGDVNLTGASHPIRLSFLNVPPDYFALLGVDAQRGRTFDPADRTPGFLMEALISDGLWRRAFGADPGILSRTLRFDNDVYRVIGVMPPGFHDPGQSTEERNAEVWLASGFAGAPAPTPVRSGRVLQEPAIVARLAPGLTLASAQSRVDALVAALQRQFPADYPPQSAWTVRLQPLKDMVVGDVRQSLLLLLGAVGLVLLIASVNVANLLLAKASARRREMAVREALGAGRRRLIAQLLTENLLLALAGGISGVGMLFATRALLVRLIPASLPRLHEVSINGTVLLFALGVTVGAGMIFGLAPALQGGRRAVAEVLRREGRSSAGSGEQARTRRVLVVTELALSLMLMIGAGLLLRSFWDLLRVRAGFSTEQVMTVRTWLPVPNDPTTDIYRTAAQEAPFLREVLRRGASLPGVEAVAIGDQASLPLGHVRSGLNRVPLLREGEQQRGSQLPLVYRALVTPEYLRLLGMTLARGRFFNDHDDTNAPPVVVVNEAFARSYWPHESALGKRLRLQDPENRTSLTWMATVIGVVADARTESLSEATAPQFYLSLYQRRAKDLAIFVRGRVDPAVLPIALREEVQALDPELPVFGAQTLEAVLDESLAGRRFSMALVALFALTALALAGLGVYGVLSYLVSERTREIGIRLALGADRGQILRMMMRQGLALAAQGALAGVVGALAASRLMAGLLYGIRPTDPLTYGGVAAILLMVALLACHLPARRAVQVHPMSVLRSE